MHPFRLRRTFERRLRADPREESGQFRLDDGSRIAVIGGGPAGSFFSYFLLRTARDVGLDLRVDLFEGRDFTCCGPAGCNHCGGIVSESLVQLLAAEGINLPPAIVRRGIDSYVLHSDAGSVRIGTPFHEKRIAALFRGAGPRNLKEGVAGLDQFLMESAEAAGAHVVRERVRGIDWSGDRPKVKTATGPSDEYDLVTMACGVNSATLRLVEGLDLAPAGPGTTKTYICEFLLGEEFIREHFGTSMHVFLLPIPRLEFAALIPKGDCLTLCLLGERIDKELVGSFLDDPVVRRLLPPDLQSRRCDCNCSPKINVRGAERPFADRLVLVGDCGVSRLYKDGIGAAYRTAKAAANTVVFYGVGAEDFRRHFFEACRTIEADNRIGKFVFAIARVLQRIAFARRTLHRTLIREQEREHGVRRMSGAVWDLFTGSAPYRDVLLGTMHPVLWGQLAWNVVASNWRLSPETRAGTEQPHEVGHGRQGLRGR